VSEVRYARLGDAIRADVGRAIMIATGACLAFALVEYIATVLSYAGSTPLLVKARLIAVVLSLSALAWLPALLITIAAVLAPRLWRHLAGRDPLAGRGALAFPLPVRGVRPGPARLWAGFAVGLVAIGVLQRWAYHVVDTKKEKQLAAAMIVIVAVVLVPLIVLAYRGASRMLGWFAVELDPVLGRASPIGRWRAALPALGALVSAGILAAWFLWPAGKSAWANIPLDHFRAFPPWRTMLPVGALITGGIIGAWWACRPRLRRRFTRRDALACALVAAIVIPVSLFRWGADLETKYVAVTASPALARAVDAIRWANDLDGDGFGSLLGENDCSPFDPRVHPGVRDLPDNGIDENCDGRDFSLRDLARPPGDKLPVPPAFKKPWNVLLLTVDTVRYDHTSFGGYKDGPKKRDTTPQLAKLVEKSTSFTFTVAPSAGTMASIPAILTSKFFHSGIALDENVKKGRPPKLKPENTLIGEIMKSGGYATGAITSHEYFNDWGMNQGMDSYDNELGKDADPYKITSSLITDRTVAWISRQQGRKWFLWVHYIDPHGRYVAHPDHVSYGTSEEDLYDGELAYTDHHIGRLLDELARLPGADRTIVIITSDHGDAFNEHGFINHGQALYRELLHIPLIISVPDNLPRKIGGAVTPLDIVPTVAELTGMDTTGMSFEGESLVPQIFYGKEDPDRIVFAETNFPTPIRAAVSAKQKLIYNLRSNLYELYDLVKDPWEKTNIWNRDPAAGSVLRDALDRWLERVLYSRDPVFNQAAAKISDALVSPRPTPQTPVEGLTFDDGRIKVLGVDYVDPHKPVRAGETTFIYVYFEALDVPTRDYKFQVLVWPANRTGFSPEAAMAGTIRTPLRSTLDGLFGTERWHKGEIIRDKFEVRVPAAWITDGMAFSLVVDDGKRLELTGPHPGGDTGAVTLGTLPIIPGQVAPPPTPAPGPAGPAGPAPTMPTPTAPAKTGGSPTPRRP
jgi:arylsulfatase A-like enzyme